jgi:hypothetical protein
VRPPRLGGNRRLGVFATRSPFRPNPIGMSAVALEKIVAEKGRVTLHLSGVDLLDGTPVLDIKPYLPYADAIADARGGFAEKRPDSSWHIVFSPQARERCQAWEQQGYPHLGNLIRQILQNDPRPAYYASRPRKNVLGMRLLDFELRWRVEPDRVIVTDLEKPGS